MEILRSRHGLKSATGVDEGLSLQGYDSKLIGKQLPEIWRRLLPLSLGCKWSENKFLSHKSKQTLWCYMPAATVSTREVFIPQRISQD